MKETSTAVIEIIDNILYFRYKDMDSLTLDVATLCVKDRLEVCDGNSYVSLFDVRKVKETSKEARDYLADEGSINVIASAIIVNSAVLRMAGNFFIKVNKPKSPTHIFTDEEEAVTWLKTQAYEAQKSS